MCDCMDIIDTKLAEAGHNTKIRRTYTLGDRIGVIPTIVTEKVDPKSRTKALAVHPNFCPWCGLNYESGLPAKAAKAQEGGSHGNH